MKFTSRPDKRAVGLPHRALHIAPFSPDPMRWRMHSEPACTWRAEQWAERRTPRCRVCTSPSPWSADKVRTLRPRSGIQWHQKSRPGAKGGLCSLTTRRAVVNIIKVLHTLAVPSQCATRGPWGRGITGVRGIDSHCALLPSCRCHQKPCLGSQRITNTLNPA